MTRTLIIQLARFGDLVQTKRLVLSLQDLGHELHLCVDRSLEPLARLLYPQTRVHAVRAHRANGDALRVLLENRAVFDALAARRFDEIYNLNYSGLNFRLSALFPPERVRGYRQEQGQEQVDPWASLAMRWSRDRRVGLNLVDFWAGYAPRLRPPGQVNPVAEARGGGLGVVLAGRETRRSLPIPVLVEVADTVRKSAGQGRVLLLGSAAESPAARQFLRLAPAGLAERCEDLTGRTDWRALADVVSGLDRVLTPDTGVMHLAAHLGVPVTAFFLSSAWCFETGPYGLGHTVFQAVDSCLPCLENTPCPHGVRCLAPLAAPAFLRFLTTRKAAHALPGLLGLQSGFDALGATCLPFGGEDADAPRRTAFRAFLAEHLGLERPDPTPEDRERGGQAAMGAEYAERLYLDRNWAVSPDKKRSPDLC